MMTLLQKLPLLNGGPLAGNTVANGLRALDWSAAKQMVFRNNAVSNNSVTYNLYGDTGLAGFLTER